MEKMRGDLSVSWTQSEFAGKLIAVSGLDGSGKTTTVRLIMDILAQEGISATALKLPSSAVRNISYFQKYSRNHRLSESGAIDLFALCLVLDGDNLMTLRTEAIPKLRSGKTVVCDRFVYESIAEMAATNSNPDDLRALLSLYGRYPRPDLGIITCPPVATAVERVRERPDETDHQIDVPLWERFDIAFRMVAQDNGLQLLSTLSIEEARARLHSYLDVLYCD